MQYVGKVGDYVYSQWNSLNPATLSGAIDVIVIEHPDGTLHTSPWHVRFGVLQIAKPSQKKIDLYVNGTKTNLPMKLSEGGEAHFVFELEGDHPGLSHNVLTSPIISPLSSPDSSPVIGATEPPDDLDLTKDNIEDKIKLSDIPSPVMRAKSPTPSVSSKVAIESARKITQKFNIPTKIDLNGDMLIDMDGYKANSKKNIENSDELFKKIFLEEFEGEYPQGEKIKAWEHIISKDDNGNYRISNVSDELQAGEPDDIESIETSAPVTESSTSVSFDTNSSSTKTGETSGEKSEKTYFKTLRLTSEQLCQMNLHYGENSLKFQAHGTNSQVTANLFLWKSTTPIVISDIDGTITKSDALGHVLNLIGRDWTHPGVANLFQEISQNGYNIIYLTARAAGQADTTRQYLQGINQDGYKLPSGPVILSPDRTFAALRREVVLKKPEVFKMACLSDIKSLYFAKTDEDEDDDDHTPFYAGFGNRITDAISYRSVHIPPHRIFTINPNGEVHMELLELAGYKSSYLHIGELVDQFFPPIRAVSSISSYWNNAQWNAYMQNHSTPSPPGSPRSPGSPGSPRSFIDEFRTDEKFNDVNYWREPIDFDNLSDSDDDAKCIKESPTTSPNTAKKGAKLSHDAPTKPDHTGNPDLVTQTPKSNKERPVSGSSFTSPLKSFMMFGKKRNDGNDEDDEYEGNHEKVDEDEFTEDEIDEEDDDYTDDDYEDDYDEEDEDDYDEDEEDEEDDYDEEEGSGEIFDVNIPGGFGGSPNLSQSKPKKVSLEKDIDKLNISNNKL